MNVGEYWLAELLDTGTVFFFKILASENRRKKKVYLAAKCGPRSGKLITKNEEGAAAEWFYESGKQVSRDGFRWALLEKAELE